MRMFVALLSGLLLSSAALAQHEHGASPVNASETTNEAGERSGNSSAQTGSDAAAAEEGAERVICRRVDRSESRLSRQRLCMTARQWRDHNRNN